MDNMTPEEYARLIRILARALRDLGEGGSFRAAMELERTVEVYIKRIQIGTNVPLEPQDEEE